MTSPKRYFEAPPSEVTREDILEHLASWQGPGVGNHVCGLLYDIAELRGFEPFTSEEIVAKQRERGEQAKLFQKKREAEEDAEIAIWISTSLDELETLIKSEGILAAQRSITKTIKEYKRHSSSSIRGRVQFAEAANKMLEEYSRKAVQID